MPSWSKKDQRMYERIKDSSVRRGKSEERAKELAARTVNKKRRKSGETPNRTTQGTGNPNLSLEKRTFAELRNIASKLKLSGRSKMKKSELVEAIRDQRS